MQINLAPFFSSILSVLAAVASTVMPVMVASLMKRFNIANSATLTDQLQSVAATAGGLAYQALATNAAQPPSAAIKDQAIAQGVDHVLAVAPAVVSALGLDQSKITSIVTGELGKLLAQDPTLAAGPSATAPATIVSSPSLASLPATGATA